jgi:hypothetical protein
MPEKFFNIPRKIIRTDGGLEAGGHSGSAELKLIDLGEKDAFMLQMASVMIMEQRPIENLWAAMLLRDVQDLPISSMQIPIFPSGHLNADGSGIFVGTVQGPIPVKPGERLCFQIQWKPITGTALHFHAKAWGYIAN